MTKLGKLEYDADTIEYICTHKLGKSKIAVYLDASEESVDLQRLIDVAETVSSEWSRRHKALSKYVADALRDQGHINADQELSPSECIPFYLRVYTDPDGEMSFTVAFNVPSVLDDENEYVEVEQQIHGEWTNTDVCSTE